MALPVGSRYCYALGQVSFLAYFGKGFGTRLHVFVRVVYDRNICLVNCFDNVSYKVRRFANAILAMPSYADAIISFLLIGGRE